VIPVAVFGNKEDKFKHFDHLLSQTERHNSRAAANPLYAVHHPMDSSNNLNGNANGDKSGGNSTRMICSTITKHVVEKATIGGTTNNFAPTIISNTLNMTRMRF